MKFGASSWPFQWDPPYEDAIRRIAGLGFKAIELIAWNPDYLRDYYIPANIKSLKSTLNGEGIQLSQFVSTPHDLASADKAKREAAFEHFKRVLEVGVELGSGIINSVSSWPFGMRNGKEFPRIVHKPLMQMFTAPMPRGLDWDRNYADYVEMLKRCAALAEKAKVFYSIEPHPYAYVSEVSSALRLIEHVDSPALGINYDPSHTFPCGDFPNVAVYRLGKHIKHLHVSDNDGVTNVHWRPGMGKIDWKEMFQALKDVGYDGVVSIELEDVPGTSRGLSDAAGVFRNKTATAEFDRESVAAADYLKGICKELGIKVE